MTHYEVADGPVHELRVAFTVADLEGAVAFYRDALGLPEVLSWADGDRAGSILAAGRATLELLSEAQADFVDEVEAGRRFGAPVRLALAVPDPERAARALTDAGAELLGGPVLTPWADRNVRLRAPEGTQLTLFARAEPA